MPAPYPTPAWSASRRRNPWCRRPWRAPLRELTRVAPPAASTLRPWTAGSWSRVRSSSPSGLLRRRWDGPFARSSRARSCRRGTWRHHARSTRRPTCRPARSAASGPFLRLSLVAARGSRAVSVFWGTGRPSSLARHTRKTSRGSISQARSWPPPPERAAPSDRGNKRSSAFLPVCPSAYSHQLVNQRRNVWDDAHFYLELYYPPLTFPRAQQTQTYGGRRR